LVTRSKLASIKSRGLLAQARFFSTRLVEKAIESRLSVPKKS